ncbi:helix-turn-helix domain-containing protein [Flavobacterium aquicola]|uniref:AraC family transcriptional regulator n=1 Tax=Flavobacterium aquicola TaxID=1682742 RepID=A0A3E0EN82_9FLAO|nr:helix-turn-helix domain-containing protein [Flavobacterium aquicola]REG99631.1 AraC family transcriptional regulator [Flavobacterium aquicola]
MSRINHIFRIAIIFLISVSTVSSQTTDLVFSPINVSDGLSDNQIRFILQLSDGRMVFKTSGNINLYDGEHFKYIHHNTHHIYPLKSYNGFYRIYQGKDSLLWIKDAYKLMCVDLRTEKYLPDLDIYFKKKGFKKSVDDLFLDSGKQLWFLSSGRLWKYNSSDFIDIKANKGQLQDLDSHNNILYLFFSTGEVVCHDLKTGRKLYNSAAYPVSQHDFFNYTSMVVKGKHGFFQLRNGSKGGFFYFDIQKKVWKKILETSYTLNTLAVTKDDIAYISCTNGIWIINSQSGQKQYLPILKKVDGSILKTEVSTLFYDKQGGLWLGTLNQGLLYYHPSRYKFKYIGRSAFESAEKGDVTVQSFAEEKNGTIYIKAGEVIYHYSSMHENEKTLTVVKPSSVPLEILKKLHKTSTFIGKNNETAFLKDIRGWEWRGTQDGLKLFDPQKKKKRIFYTKDGLSNNFVHAILEDHNHNIWITTSYGITKMQIDSVNKKISFTTFGSDEGTLQGEYSDGAAFEAVDGTLYFGGINGFNTLKTNHVSQEKLPFKPVFTNLFLKGEKIEAGVRYDGRVIMPEAAPYTKEIELSYDQNFLTLEFSALNYQNPSQTYYRYQLKGIDNDWRETSTGGGNENWNNGILTASYTNLPHGNYTFLVMASGNDRKWDGAVSELRINIKAPWWKTTTAYVLFILLFTASIAGGIFLYLYYSRKKIEQNHKEDILLLRIRNLIDQCSYLETEKENYLAQTNLQSVQSAETRNENRVDEMFLAKALELVEKNLNVPDYSVENLSRDLCMDRTGLYRKLIALLDKPPSLFIRNIRLQKAAGLLLEGELSISEITERVGFSSSSYLSKCFQEMYGCRPSEYAEMIKKST